ncbi:MAG TPA: hypothetical protein VG871_03100 [Vicinamibacterales bacterium]|nr:hypothetical protein [Vicinamibacterales bacterium]
MRVRTRHPRLSAAACRVYGAAIWLYPAEFRRAFGRELAVTFRNDVEDALNDGGVAHWAKFAVHIAVDWIRTCVTLLTQPVSHDSVSLLGLGDGDVASGCLDRVTVDVSLLLAILGLVVALIGWYAFFVILPRYYV